MKIRAFIFLTLSLGFTRLVHTNGEKVAVKYSPITSVDNPISFNGKQYEVQIEDHRPETYDNHPKPDFFLSNYFTPLAFIDHKDFTKKVKVIVIPIDWIREILRIKNQLPQWLQTFIPSSIPTIPQNAVVYASKVYPGKCYIIFPAQAN